MPAEVRRFSLLRGGGGLASLEAGVGIMEMIEGFAMVIANRDEIIVALLQSTLDGEILDRRECERLLDDVQAARCDMLARHQGLRARQKLSAEKIRALKAAKNVKKPTRRK
jgi:hypothetical protein